MCWLLADFNFKNKFGDTLRARCESYESQTTDTVNKQTYTYARALGRLVAKHLVLALPQSIA